MYFSNTTIHLTESVPTTEGHLIHFPHAHSVGATTVGLPTVDGLSGTLCALCVLLCLPKEFLAKSTCLLEACAFKYRDGFVHTVLANLLGCLDAVFFADL